MVKQNKQLGCLDVNPQGGCAFEVRAATEEDVLRLHCHSEEALPSDMV